MRFCEERGRAGGELRRAEFGKKREVGKWRKYITLYCFFCPPLCRGALKTSFSMFAWFDDVIVSDKKKRNFAGKNKREKYITLYCFFALLFAEGQ